MGNQPQDPFSQFLNSINPFGQHPAPQHPAARPAASQFTPMEPGHPGIYNLPTWLLFVKTEAAPRHWQDLASHIHLDRRPDGVITARVDDPSVLRQIEAMRRDPQLNASLAQEYRNNHHNIPVPHVEYAGAGNRMDPALMRDQQNLQTLGFDIGGRPNGFHNLQTDAALQEFAAQARPPIAAGQLHNRLDQAARQATQEAARINRNMPDDKQATPAVAYAIANASNATGVSHGYLNDLVQRESSFQADAMPPAIPGHRDKRGRWHEGYQPAARGLFQVEPDTWLTLIHREGAQYGLGRLAQQVHVGNDGRNPTVSDPATRDYILSLRNDPRLNALLGAELQQENQQIVNSAAPNLRDNSAAIYAVHFLGGSDGRDFLEGLHRRPNEPAASAFSPSVSSGVNHNVFYDHGRALSFHEVFARLERSFGIRDHASAAPDATMVASDRSPPQPGGPRPS